MPQDKDRRPADEPVVDTTPWYAKPNTDVPAAGNDPDSRLREMKAQLARAEVTGDDGAVEQLRKEIEKTQKDHPAVAKTPQQAAAEARRDAATSDAGARTRAPQGRTATPPAKATTGSGATSGSADKADAKSGPAAPASDKDK